jgi:hypothetical protein
MSAAVTSSRGTLGGPPSTPTLPFDVGTLVSVQSRTWPGINKPGGVGRVVAADPNGNTINVKYVLGGVEKCIDVEFVEEHQFVGDDNEAKNGAVSGGGRARRKRQEPAVSVKDQKPQSAKKARVLKDASSNANKKKDDQEKSKVVKKRKVQKETEVKNEKVVKKKKANVGKKANKANSTTTQAKRNYNEKSIASSQHSTIKTAKKKVPSQISMNTVVPSSTKSKELASKLKSATTTATSDKTNRWKIRSPANVLKHVYNDIKNQATSFVGEMVGKKSSAAPSSPDSTVSLEIQLDNRLVERFFSFILSLIFITKLRYVILGKFI